MLNSNSFIANSNQFPFPYTRKMLIPDGQWIESAVIAAWFQAVGTNRKAILISSSLLDSAFRCWRFVKVSLLAHIRLVRELSTESSGTEHQANLNRQSAFSKSFLRA
jgi:hypothetical protein